MFAATSPTCSLEIPETVIFRLPSTVKVMPSGGSTVTVWEKPRESSMPWPLAATR